MRLIDAYADAHAGGGMHYAVGEIWEIETEAAEIEPPHVEDVRVLSNRRAGRQRDVAAVIEARMAPVAGSVDGPLRGHLQRDRRCALRE